MSLQILIVAATQTEADIVGSLADMVSVTGGYKFYGCEIILLVTGVGSVATAWAMTKFITSGSKPDLALNIGIAGSYKDDIKLGEVVCPVSDLFADVGVDTGKGFLTLAEAGLENPDAYPFRSGKIMAENNYSSAISRLLRPVNAITVNTATGSGNITTISEKYNPDIETMEGAAFFYVCTRENIPFAAIRSVSNRVEPIRDKTKWNIPFALNNLSKSLKDVLLML